MSISPPRYAAPSVPRVGRGSRAVTIFGHELRACAGWGTGLVVAFGYLAILLSIVLTVEFTPPGLVTLSTFFAPFQSPLWPFLILLVAATTGAGAIAEDLTSRSLTLYLSRPIPLADYLGAKTAAVGCWIAAVAVGPGVVGVIVAAALGTASAELALSAIGAFLAVGILVTVFFTGLAIALSAWSGRALYAGVAIFGITLALEVAAGVISGITGNAQIRYLAVFTLQQNVAMSAFQTGDVTSTDPSLSAVALAIAGALLLVAAWQRLVRAEVVGE